MVVVLTPSEMLSRGLNLVGWNDIELEGKSNKKKQVLFKGFYGSDPIVCCQLWEDLQTTEPPNARINAQDQVAKVNNFLITCHWLYRYPTVIEEEVIFKITDKVATAATQFFTKKLAALKVNKVRTLMCLVYLF